MWQLLTLSGDRGGASGAMGSNSSSSSTGGGGRVRRWRLSYSEGGGGSDRCWRPSYSVGGGGSDRCWRLSYSVGGGGGSWRNWGYRKIIAIIPLSVYTNFSAKQLRLMLTNILQITIITWDCWYGKCGTKIHESMVRTCMQGVLTAIN